MLHKYRVKNTGTIFFFDNKTNALFDVNKNQLSKTLVNKEQRQEINSECNEFHVEKIAKPTELKIILGHKCNFSCGYCVQSDVGNRAAPEKGFGKSAKNLDIVNTLISNLRSKLDLSRLVQVEVWGGETLLYWDQVKTILKEFDAPDFDFVMPTNGILLSQKHIDFLLELKGRTTIELSHDGPVQQKNRGKDYLHKLVDVFKKIEQNPDKVRCEIKTTITKNYYDFIEINNFFRDFFYSNKLTPYPIGFRPVWVYDTNSSNFSVQNDLDGYYEKLTTYLDKQIEQFKRLKRVDNDEMIESDLFHVSINDDYNNGVLYVSSKMKSELDYTPSTVCGMHQSDKLVVDVNGNIRACQNVGTDIFNGNILDFNNNTKAIKLKGILPNKHQPECHQCPVFLLCLSGCPLDFNKKFFDINCQVSKVHNKAILHSAFKLLFNDDVEYLGAEYEGN